MVRFEGDEERYRRFGLLAAFRSTIGLVLVCRRRLPKPGGKGFRIDDFLMSLQQPLPADKRVEFHGRCLGGMPVSDTTWRRMDAIGRGGRVIVNGIPLVRADRWDAWLACRRRIFTAGCPYSDWK